MKIAKMIVLTSLLFIGVNANDLCGNGVKDLSEECDSSDSKHQDWGNKGCSENCTYVVGKNIDQTFYYKLRYGRIYRFTLDYVNDSSNKVKIKGKNIRFQENGWDIDGTDRIINLDWSTKISSQKYIVNVGQKILIVRANDDNLYNITYYPTKRDKKNVQMTYEIPFTKLINGHEKGYFYHRTKVNYEITRCGDGVIDDYTERGGFVVHEECDDGNEKSGDGCSSTCQLEK